jgi:Undecaprenyl-phosphate glucose phosphotransferase
MRGRQAARLGDMQAPPTTARVNAFSPAAERPFGASVFASDVRSVFLGALRLADVATIALAAVASFWLRHGTVSLPAYYWWQIMVACLIAANGFYFAQLYSLRSLREKLRHLRRLAASWTATMSAMIILLYFTKSGDEFSRIWTLSWALTSFIGLLAVRLGCWTWLARNRARSLLVSNLAVVGDEGAGERLARRIEEAGAGDVRVLGVFRHLPRHARPSATPCIDDLVDLTRRTRIDQIAIALPCAGVPGFEASLRTLATVPTDLKLCLDVRGDALLGITSRPVPELLLSRRPLAGWRTVVKRMMDLAISTLLLIAFLPLMMVIAVLIRLDSPGPSIFRQQRFGFNKQTITIYKFRTMRHALNPDPAVPQARRNDPRLTRIGGFLRQTSLDELPQLFNVLLGNMSLVGPRPHAIPHDDKYAALIDNYLARHRVKPGITGWAQVNGFRGETDTIEKMKSRIAYDLFYIDHWSVLFDLRILLVTLSVGLSHRNAY